MRDSFRIPNELVHSDTKGKETKVNVHCSTKKKIVEEWRSQFVELLKEIKWIKFLSVQFSITHNNGHSFFFFFRAGVYVSVIIMAYFIKTKREENIAIFQLSSLLDIFISSTTSKVCPLDSNVNNVSPFCLFNSLFFLVHLFTCFDPIMYSTEPHSSLTEKVLSSCLHLIWSIHLEPLRTKLKRNTFGWNTI